MKIIIYVVDCLRADHVSAYGYHRQTTPNIDLLAQDGILFENAFSPSTWTKPVAASLLTGLYPPVHGLRQRTDVLTKNIRTIPEWLQNYGYNTIAISTIGNVSSSLGYGKGFGRFVDLYKDPALQMKRPLANIELEKLHNEKQGEVIFPLAEDINDTLFPWLETHLDQNVFAFLWAMDPHDPYCPPKDWNKFITQNYKGMMDGSREKAKQAQTQEDLNYLIDLYDSEINYTDHCLGNLVSYLKKKDIYEETAIFVLGDHGEAFGDHGHMLHGHLPFEEIIHVPLIVKLPEQSWAGNRVSGLVSLVDVMPTILELASVPSNNWAAVTQGKSLLNGLQKGADSTHKIVFSETQATEVNNAVYSVRTANWKYIEIKSPPVIKRVFSLIRTLSNWTTLKSILLNPRFYFKRQIGGDKRHLYYIPDDPSELKNCAANQPQLSGEYKTAIEEWRQQCEELAKQYEELAVHSEIDEVTLKHLRALGYIE